MKRIKLLHCRRLQNIVLMALATVVCLYLLVLYWVKLSQNSPVISSRKFLRSWNGVLPSQRRNNSRPSVTCLLMTSPKRHELARHMTATWIQECDHVVTMTSAMDLSLTNVHLTRYSSYDELWGKVLEGFKEADPLQSSWFLKADDDTFVVMRNLVHFLAELNATEPLLAGLQLLYSDNKEITIGAPYVSGGAGYVLSQAALKKFQTQVGIQPCSLPGVTPYEDVNMGICLDSLGVKQVDTRDALGRQRFLPYPPWIMMDPDVEEQDVYSWLKMEPIFPVPFGAEFLTDEPISFHEVRNAVAVYNLQYFLNVLKVLPR